MDYARSLKTARAVRGLSQKGLAAKLGVSPSYLCQVETGKRAPSMQLVERLAEALDVPVYLFMLLGSDQQDLRGISMENAKILGQELLQVVVALRSNKQA